jgi:hypothetical protein
MDLDGHTTVNHSPGERLSQSIGFVVVWGRKSLQELSEY